MKRLFFYIMASAAVWFAACTVEGTYTGEITPHNPEPDLYTMTLTVRGSGDKTISMAGTGTIEIDWGDGSAKEKPALSSTTEKNFTHKYTSITDKNITITGENIIFLKCFSNQLVDLDITKNPKLTELNCWGNDLIALNMTQNTALKKINCSFNKLTLLDVGKNIKLAELSCNNNALTALDVKNNTELYKLTISTNQFDAGSLDELFGTLHNKSTGGEQGKIIYIAKNPGTGSCHVNLATTKGWVVNSEIE